MGLILCQVNLRSKPENFCNNIYNILNLQFVSTNTARIMMHITLEENPFMHLRLTRKTHSNVYCRQKTSHSLLLGTMSTLKQISE